MRVSFVACLMTLMLGAACAADGSGGEVAGRTEWIVGGSPDSRPEVVVLYNARSRGMCTGSLIAPRVILTAKHCVQAVNAPAPDAASAFTIGVGDAVNMLTQTFQAVDITTTPGSYDNRLNGLVGEDIALITLQRAIAGVEPLAIHRGDPQGLVGDDVIAVGYGQTPAGSSGTKYRASARIRFIDGNVLYMGPITCEGDSGGPILLADTNEIVAVTSFGQSVACGAGAIAGTNRVDVHIGMIDAVVRDSGSCLNDGAERCDGFDNDCNGEIDETCLPLGAECVADEECIGTTCRETPTGRRCTASCDPLQPELSCPTDLYCARTSGCDGVCLPIPGELSTPVPDDTACVDDLDCISLFCSDPGDGRRRCLTPCRGDDGLCLSGEACSVGAGSCGGCVDADIIIGRRGLGEPCAADADCASDACHIEAGLAYCTRGCVEDGECASGDRFHCRVTADGGSCIRGPIGNVGDRCVVNEDCREGTLCASRGDVSWCTNFCTDAEPCLDDFNCVDVGDASICAPSRGVVGDSCTSPVDCISGLCTGGGLCTRLCSADAPCVGPLECVRTTDGTTAACVAPASAPLDQGGCSAAAGVGSAATPFGFWAGLLGLFAWSRRRG